MKAFNHFAITLTFGLLISLFSVGQENGRMVYKDSTEGKHLSDNSNFDQYKIQTPSRWFLSKDSSIEDAKDIPFAVVVFTDSTQGYFELFSKQDTINIFNYEFRDHHLYLSSVDYNCDCFEKKESGSQYILPYDIKTANRKTYLIVYCNREGKDIEIVYVLD